MTVLDNVLGGGRHSPHAAVPEPPPVLPPARENHQKLRFGPREATLAQPPVSGVPSGRLKRLRGLAPWPSSPSRKLLLSTEPGGLGLNHEEARNFGTGLSKAIPKGT